MKKPRKIVFKPFSFRDVLRGVLGKISPSRYYCNLCNCLPAFNEATPDPDPAVLPPEGQKTPSEPPSAFDFPVVAAANEFMVVQKDTLFVPFGEYPVTVEDPKTGRKVECIQVFDLDAANEIAGKMGGIRGKVAGMLRLLPIYIGHPDVPQLRHLYPDTKAYGWITGANVKDGGIEFDVKWGKAGQELIEDGQYVFYSPHWPMKPLGVANSVMRARPIGLWSIGLTNVPNIPVPAMAVPGFNEMVEGYEGVQSSEFGVQEDTKPSLLERLAAIFGVELDDDAIEAKALELKSAVAQIAEAEKAKQEADQQEWQAKAAAEAAAKAELTEQLTGLTEQLTGLTAQNESLAAKVTAIEAEKLTAINALVDAGIAEGRIPGGKREEFVAAFNTDFNGALSRLQSAETMFAPSRTRNIRHRKADAAAPSAAFLTAVNEAMNQGRTYLNAWLYVKRVRPELFSGMEQK
jgi:hypothetical protein